MNRIWIAALTAAMLAAGAMEARAADAAADGDSGAQRVVETVKDGGRAIGHGVHDGAVAVGHKTRQVAKAVGDGTREAAHRVGKAADDAWSDLTDK